MDTLKLGLIALLAIAITACSAEQTTAEPGKTPKPKQATAAPAATPAFVEFKSPTGPGAAEPHLFAGRDSILLSWLEPVANTDRVALRYARYRHGAWSTPQTIIERNDLFVNWADFPSLVEDAKGVLFAHWLQKSSTGTYSYDIRMATSSDGRTWGAPFLLNRDGTYTEHGFVTLAPLKGGGVGATWLDGRKMKPEGGDQHGSHDAGDMSIRYATVNAKGELAGDTELDNRACECCATGMAMTSDGPLIAYRDRSSDEVRDIAYVKKSLSGWSKPARVHADDWKINACPVNGPQVDAIGNRAAVAWFTGAQEKGRVYVAFSGDGGAKFGKPVQIDEGNPAGRVDITMIDGNSALVTWLEQVGTAGKIRARKVSSSGTVEPAMTIAESTTARAGGFARLAKLGREIYVTWTEQVGKSKLVHVARF